MSFFFERDRYALRQSPLTCEEHLVSDVMLVACVA